MDEAEKVRRVARWPGEPVAASTMLAYVEAALAPERLAARQHYVFTMPGVRRAGDTCFRLRICWYETRGTVELRGNYDGVVSTRCIQDGEVVIGSYNAVARESEPRALLDYGGLTLAFHLHHIRVHYCHFDHGRTLRNIYYHTAKPASGALALLVEALDLVIHETGERDRQERCQALLEAILRQVRHELSQAEEVEQSPRMRQAMRIKSYLEQNFTSAIRCAEVCRELRINRSYAATIFHAAFGTTMNDYVQQLRLEAAEQLLASADDLRVGEVAERCAFSDAGYFTKVFRRRYGMTPGEFRRRRRDAVPEGM
jgi:AraC-like DNA-binding protein